MAAHRSWRILIQATQASGSYVSIAEVELRAAAGGADQCGAGAAYAKHEYGGSYTAAKAVDNDNATDWMSAIGLPTWWAYDFGAPVGVAEILVRASAWDPDRAPLTFVIQYSDDVINWGSGGGETANWTTVATHTNVGNWSAGQVRTFAADTTPALPDITFGGVPATNVEEISPGVYDCDTPAHAAGAVDVALTKGGETATAEDGFTYESVRSVTFDGANATDITVIGPDELEVTVPGPHAAGLVDVVVTKDGASVTGQDAYEYLLQALTGSINPDIGSTLGGTTIRVTLFGTNRNAVSTITIDGLSMAFVDVGDGLYDVVTPAHLSGTVDIVVTAGNETLTFQFTYLIPYEYDQGYTLFVSHKDKTVEPLPATLHPTDPYKVILSQPPRMALSLDDEFYAKATYQLVKNESPREHAFLVVEREPRSNFTSIVSAVNYDARYYQNDHDNVTEDQFPWEGLGVYDPENPPPPGGEEGEPNIIPEGEFNFATGWTLDKIGTTAEASIVNGRLVLEYEWVYFTPDRLWELFTTGARRTFTVPESGNYRLEVEGSGIGTGEELYVYIEQGGVNKIAVIGINGWKLSDYIALEAGVATVQLMVNYTGTSHTGGTVNCLTVACRAEPAP